MGSAETLNGQSVGFDVARGRIAEWARDGRIVHREDVLDGLERTPEAFLRLLTSQNFGKQLVHIAD